MPKPGESVTYHCPIRGKVPAIVLRSYKAPFDTRDPKTQKVLARTELPVVDLACPAIDEDLGGAIHRGLFEGAGPHRYQIGPADSLSGELERQRRRADEADGVLAEAQQIRADALEALRQANDAQAAAEADQARAAAVADQLVEARALIDSLASDLDEATARVAAVTADRDALGAELVRLEALRVEVESEAAGGA